MLDAEINFDSYKVLCCDGKGWGVSLLYKKSIKSKYSIDPPPWNWKYIFFEFFLVNSKPTKVRTIHCSLTQSNLVKVLSNNMNIIDSVINEVYIPGDFNIVDFNIAQRGVIDISFFDIPFIYCTRKVSRIRRRYKQI